MNIRSREEHAFAPREQPGRIKRLKQKHATLFCRFFMPREKDGETDLREADAHESHGRAHNHYLCLTIALHWKQVFRA
jgi:hypothetical protein